MLEVEYTGQFRRDYKLAGKQGRNIPELKKVVNTLASGKKLPEKYRDHRLNDSKYFKKCRECHIEPDWLLVYQISEKRLILRLLRTGSHSDIFN